jgi:hypothetical protein
MLYLSKYHITISISLYKSTLLLFIYDNIILQTLSFSFDNRQYLLTYYILPSSFGFRIHLIVIIHRYGYGNNEDSDPKYTNKVVTLWYRSPELLLGSVGYNAMIDIWSAGCILAELLLGKALFPGKDEMDQLKLIFNLMGTPSEDTWAALQETKTERNLETKAKKDIVPNVEIKSEFDNKYGNDERLCSSQGAKMLIMRLLEMNPKRRWSAEKALDSQYFRSKPFIPQDINELGSLPDFGDSHEFQTKPIRKKAKLIAQKASKKAKATGGNEKEAWEKAYADYLAKAAQRRAAGLPFDSEDEDTNHENKDSSSVVVERNKDERSSRKRSQDSSSKHESHKSKSDSDRRRSKDRSRERHQGERDRRKYGSDDEDDRRKSDKDRKGSSHRDSDKRRNNDDSKRNLKIDSDDRSKISSKREHERKENDRSERKRSRDRSKDRVTEKGKGRDRSYEKSRGKSPERSHEKSRDKKEKRDRTSRSRSRGRKDRKSSRDSKDKSRRDNKDRYGSDEEHDREDRRHSGKDKGDEKSSITRTDSKDRDSSNRRDSKERSKKSRSSRDKSKRDSRGSSKERRRSRERDDSYRYDDNLRPPGPDQFFHHPRGPWGNPHDGFNGPGGYWDPSFGRGGSKGPPPPHMHNERNRGKRGQR